MFKFSQLFSKQKDDKIIIMGKSGSGKSFMAMQLAVNNKGTTILANGCEIAYKSYMESTYYPSIKDFVKETYYCLFTIKKGEKYFVEETRPAVCRNVELINTMALHSDYNILRNDKKAMIVYDDNSWNYQGEKDRIELLKKLSQIKCQVVITVDCWDDLIGKNTRTMDVDDLEAIKKNIENWGWKTIQLK